MILNIFYGGKMIDIGNILTPIQHYSNFGNIHIENLILSRTEPTRFPISEEDQRLRFREAYINLRNLLDILTNEKDKNISCKFQNSFDNLKQAIENERQYYNFSDKELELDKIFKNYL